MYHQVQQQMVEENYLVNINDLPLTYGISESVHNLNVEWWGIVRLAETGLEG